MSLVCPQCQSTLDQDFGIFNCPNCKALLVADLNGEIQLSEKKVFSQDQNSEVEKIEFQELNFENLDPQLDPQKEIQVMPTNPEDVHNPAAVPYEDLDFEPLDKPEVIPPPAASDLKDVLDFANSVEPSGPLSYSLAIKGIDLAEQKELLKEVFKDPKFQFNVAEMISRIRDGSLEIKNLTPAQTSVLVQKLRASSLILSWRQHLYDVE